MVTTDENGFATLLSPQPSPPPPPPPVPELDPHAPMHPPAPPSTVSGQMLITRYEGFILDLEAQEVELVLKLDDCFVKDRAEGTVCGLNSNEAPDPWMAIGGVKCSRLRHALDARGRLLRLLGKRHEPDGGREEAAPGTARGRPLLLRLQR